jgi:hypothetical protein
MNFGGVVYLREGKIVLEIAEAVIEKLKNWNFSIKNQDIEIDSKSFVCCSFLEAIFGEGNFGDRQVANQERLMSFTHRLNCAISKCITFVINDVMNFMKFPKHRRDIFEMFSSRSADGKRECWELRIGWKNWLLCETPQMAIVFEAA